MDRGPEGVAKSTPGQTLRTGQPVIIQDIVDEHADEAAFLWMLRDGAVRAPHYDLADLAELDERVEAHLDGLRVGGEAGWELLVERLRQNQDAGEAFAAGVLALESKSPKRLDPVLAAAEAGPEAARGLVSALGWVTPKQLQGTGKVFLNGGTPFLRRLGIAACAVHRTDPGERLHRAVHDEDAGLRARALRAVGELGREDLLPTAAERAAAADEDDACRFWAAWSAVLLGERGKVLEWLKLTCISPSPFAARALEVVPRALEPAAAQAWLKGLVGDAALLRPVIQATGRRGDPHYVPWLIKQMETPELARVAGEALAMITGVDLAYQGLEGDWPEGFEAGPSENPDDDDIAMDADEDLPWPAPDLVKAWWAENQGNFEAGTRHLCGQPLTAERCRAILATGFQRQRNAAALELALLEPGKPLFETRAPGLRQQEALGLKGRAA